MLIAKGTEPSICGGLEFMNISSDASDKPVDNAQRHAGLDVIENENNYMYMQWVICGIASPQGVIVICA